MMPKRERKDLDEVCDYLMDIPTDETENYYDDAAEDDEYHVKRGRMTDAENEDLFIQSVINRPMSEIAQYFPDVPKHEIDAVQSNFQSINFIPLVSYIIDSKNKEVVDRNSGSESNLLGNGHSYSTCSSDQSKSTPAARFMFDSIKPKLLESTKIKNQDEKKYHYNFRSCQEFKGPKSPEAQQRLFRKIMSQKRMQRKKEAILMIIGMIIIVMIPVTVTNYIYSRIFSR